MTSIPTPLDGVNTPQPTSREIIGSQSTDDPVITVSVNDIDLRFGSQELQDGILASLLLDQIGTAMASSAVIQIDPLFSMEPNAQLFAIELIGNIASRFAHMQLVQLPTEFGTQAPPVPTVQIASGAVISSDPFSAVLAALPPGLPIEAQFTARRTLIHAVQIWHAATPKLACRHVQERFMACRYVRPDLSELESAVREIATAAIERPTQQILRRVSEIFPDCGFAGELVIPPGWTVTAEGITRNGYEKILAPVLIGSRYSQYPSKIELVKLWFLCRGQWGQHVVKRGVIANSRTIVELADYGFPVTTNTAPALVQYLAEFEAANPDALRPEIAVQQFGWFRDQNVEGFVIGHDFITADNLPTGSPQGTPVVRFRGMDEGSEQIARGFRIGGTMEGWLAAISPLAQFPRVQLALYASLAPPLLQLVKAPNTCFCIAWDSTGGKTTTNRSAASAWGQPNEEEAESALATWRATPVYLERLAGIISGVPLLIDETKHAMPQDAVAAMIYAVVSGRGKGRGTVGGVASTQSFKTILMCTGEKPMTSFSGDGGTRARVLALWGSPFGRADEEMSELARILNGGIREHYGHAGRAFVRFLLNRRIPFETLQMWYDQRVQHFTQRAGNDRFKCRMAQALALIDVAACVAHHAIPQLPWHYHPIVDELYDVLTADAHEADRATAAVECVMSWAYSHRGDFHPEHRDYPPSGGWAGQWDQRDDWQFVAFYPGVLNRILTDGKFEVPAIQRTWKDKGWLRTNPGRNTLRMRVEGKQESMIAITRAAIDHVMGSDDDAGRGAGGNGGADPAARQP